MWLVACHSSVLEECTEPYFCRLSIRGHSSSPSASFPLALEPFERSPVLTVTEDVRKGWDIMDPLKEMRSKFCTYVGQPLVFYYEEEIVGCCMYSVISLVETEGLPFRSVYKCIYF